MNKSRQSRRARWRTRRCAGLSLAETIVSLAIAAMLLVATTAATVASFRAYGDAVEQASAQVTTRMASQRLLALIRTSTAHGPLMPNAKATLDGDILTSSYLELVEPDGDIVRCEYLPDDEQLWLTITPVTGEKISQPLLSGVSDAEFKLRRRLNDHYLWVLERATINLSVRGDEDATLAIENGPAQTIRLVASTVPRKLE